ncbi:hypothetical protein [Puerhibacterium puerhi]|uniref:hypothetical protein n=1 Tax=Puerhibacterium puerhi TaxID=2692623 RepID=UPI001F18195F|nr:hypothetical protein [Puerhibacterium puerhi]
MRARDVRGMIRRDGQDPDRAPNQTPGQNPDAARDAGSGSDGTPDDLDHWTEYQPSTVVEALVDRAVTIPSATIHRHVDRLRARNPHATPAQIVRMLEKEYLAVVATAGGAVGLAAAVPAVGTGAGVALTSADIATFFASSAAFALAVADVHGIDVDDVARRRALLLATVLGDKGARDVQNAIGGSTTAWGKVLLTSLPQGSVRRVNNALTHRFLRKQLAKQGSLALGRLVPFGVGAVVGVAGGRALGHGVVAQSRRAFGPPPDHFPRVVEGEVEAAGPDGAAPPSRWLGRRGGRG